MFFFTCKKTLYPEWHVSQNGQNAKNGQNAENGQNDQNGQFYLQAFQLSKYTRTSLSLKPLVRYWSWDH